jgi:hypothetical protein
MVERSRIWTTSVASSPEANADDHYALENEPSLTEFPRSRIPTPCCRPKTQGGTQENRPEGRLGEVAALLGAVIGRDTNAVSAHCLCAAPDEWPAGAIM